MPSLKPMQELMTFDRGEGTAGVTESSLQDVTPVEGVGMVSRPSVDVLELNPRVGDLAGLVPARALAPRAARSDFDLFSPRPHGRAVPDRLCLAGKVCRLCPRRCPHSCLWWLEGSRTPAVVSEWFITEENETLFRTYVRMDINSFYTLVSKVEGYIQRQETNMRQSISPAAHVEATLRYLATGCCYTSLQYSTRISKQSLSIIIPETCDAIYEALKDDYMKVPTTPEEWMRVAQGFFTRWNFPNCLGAIDGKHILIRPPQDSGSYFFNYKGTHSIVLLAVCDANLEFLYVDIGANGRVSDGGVWNNSDLCRRIANNTAGLPTDKHVPGVIESCLTYLWQTMLSTAEAYNETLFTPKPNTT
ncbi:uncharacterized protein [Macrobrachium rosenbergii]|uniref:uncharacterized protein n=1 Tax=Macrobrachium rosenbergii TaxID=79674 RepID=UPI0034D602A3